MQRSTTVTECRFWVDEPRPGAWNMALDEALLESAAADGLATLRFYRWQEPTLSLGYFQRHQDRELHVASRGCPLTRRQSGGGAIIHDQELTYSLALPGDHRLAAGAAALYDAVHESLIAALATFGVEARLCHQADDLPPTEQPFLCFQRRAAGDVLVGDAKIAGSAQRRRYGAVLQHGSVLLARSAAAPELPGIAELAAPVSIDALIPALRAQLDSRLALAFTDSESTPAEDLRASAVATDKYQASGWIERR